MRLGQPGPNHPAVGARVVVEAGSWRATRWMLAGGDGLASSGPAELHFGLGTRPAVDRITVVWPDATRSVLGPVSANQHLEIRRLDFE